MWLGCLEAAQLYVAQLAQGVKKQQAKRGDEPETAVEGGITPVILCILGSPIDRSHIDVYNVYLAQLAFSTFLLFLSSESFTALN